MKKLFNQAPVLLTVAIILGLTGCISDNPYDPRNGEDAAIFLQIAQPATSRAVSNPIATDGLTAAPFLTGDLYLATQQGVIIEHFSIVASGGTVPTGANREIPATATAINVSDLTYAQGIRITGVPPGVRGGQVVVVGNTSNNATAGTTSNIGNRVIDVLHQGQNNLDSPGSGVNLFGSATLGFYTTINGVRTYRPQGVPAAGGIPAVPAGTLRINPTIARLEIPNIMGMGYIQSFSVEGVFIDRFYRNAHVNGSVVTTSLVDNADVGNTFAWNTAGYPAAFHGITFDWYAQHTGTPWGSALTDVGLNFDLPVASPGGTNVWSYHLFAQTNTRVPRIVFRLNNIVLRPNASILPITGVRYVTFNSFVVHGGVNDGNNIGGIRAGDIYRIPTYRLAFSHEHLEAEPSVSGGATTLSTRAVPLEVEELIIAN